MEMFLKKGGIKVVYNLNATKRDGRHIRDGRSLYIEDSQLYPVRKSCYYEINIKQ